MDEHRCGSRSALTLFALAALWLFVVVAVLLLLLLLLYEGATAPFVDLKFCPLRSKYSTILAIWADRVFGMVIVYDDIRSSHKNESEPAKLLMSSELSVYMDDVRFLQYKN